LQPRFMLSPPLRDFRCSDWRKVPEKPIANQTILALLPAGEDRKLLSAIFIRTPWQMKFTHTLEEAQRALGLSPGVVISDSCLPGGHSWKDLLYVMQNMEDPPPLIVADHLADERLWAEVLNLGGYDLLAKPFDGKEVLHAVTTACRHSENKRDGRASEASEALPYRAIRSK